MLLLFVPQEIIKQLIDNSSTFNNKTGYAQDKYIKKKKKKWVSADSALTDSCNELINKTVVISLVSSVALILCRPRYENTVTVLKPTCRILAMMYHGREPGKIWWGCALKMETFKSFP